MFANHDLEAQLKNARKACEEKANQVIAFARDVKRDTKRYAKRKSNDQCIQDKDCQCLTCAESIPGKTAKANQMEHKKIS